MGVPTEPPCGELWYRLLGPVTVLRGSGFGDEREALELGAPKQRAVLALLALHRGRLVSDDRLIDALWPEHPPPSAVPSLQAYVSNLRRVLRQPGDHGSSIARRAEGYLLEVGDERVDLSAFTRAAARARDAREQQRWAEALGLADEALALWRGEPLEDLLDQSWVRGEVAPVVEAAAECRETRITALLAEGRLAAALQAACALHLEHPTRDRVCWLRMLCLYRADRSVEALELYHRLARQLDEELGLEPSGSLRELERDILRQEPALAVWPLRATRPGPAAATAPEPVSAEVDPLIGREPERRILREVVAESRVGGARWLVLAGPAGIGKTRLARQLVADVTAAGGVAAWTCCSEEAAAPAWWPIRQLVRTLGAQPDDLLSPSGDAGVDGARFVVYERVAELLREVSRRSGPVLVVVDDAQWLDRSSAFLLAHLVSTLPDTGAIVAVALRDGEDAGAAAPLIAAIARSGAQRQLTVGPLDDDAVRELATTVAREPLSEAELADLTPLTGGNPLVISEYVRLPAADRHRGEIPLVVRAVIERRLSRLGEPTRDVLRAAAAIGPEPDMPTLAAATDLGIEQLSELLDGAADDHLLVRAPVAQGYAFAHDLVRETILAEMGATERRRLHGRLTETLRDRDGAAGSIRRARHLVAALPFVDPSEVVDGCRAAARAAAESWDPDAEAAWWAQALEVCTIYADATRDARERDELVIAQVAALARAGRGNSILEVFDEQLDEAMRSGRTSTAGRLAAALVRAAGKWSWNAYGDEAGPLLTRLASIERFVAGDPPSHARALAALAVGRCHGSDPSITERLSLRAVATAEHTGDREVLADALLARLVVASGLAAYGDAIDAAQRLCNLDHRESRVDQTIARAAVGQVLATRGEIGAAQDAVQSAIADADLLRVPVVRLQLRYLEATLAMWRGDLELAAHGLATAGRVHAEVEISHDRSHVLAELTLARERGELATATADDVADPQAWTAAILSARGHTDEARRRAGEWCEAPRPWNYLTLGHAVIVAEVVADIGAVELAPRLLSLLAPWAGAIALMGDAGIAGAVDLARGRLLSLLGENDAAQDLLETTLTHASATGGVPAARRCRQALAVLSAPPRAGDEPTPLDVGI